MEVIEELNNYVANFEQESQPKEFKELYMEIIKSSLLATKNCELFVAEKANFESSYMNADTKSLLTILEVLIQFAFNICLSPIAGNDPNVWVLMDEFCDKFVMNKIFIHIWQRTMIVATNNLMEWLCNMPKKDYMILSNPELLPFKKLGMSNEYSFQVLLNAFKSPNDPKYSLVHKMGFYVQYFQVWMRVLQIVKLRTDFEDKTILIEYIKSIIMN